MNIRIRNNKQSRKFLKLLRTLNFQRRLDDKNIYKNAKTKQFIAAYVIETTPARKLTQVRICLENRRISSDNCI